MDSLELGPMVAVELCLLVSIVLCFVALTLYLLASVMGTERKKGLTDRGNWLSTEGSRSLLSGAIALGIGYALAYARVKLGTPGILFCQYAPRSLWGFEGMLLPVGAACLALGILLLIYQKAATKLVPPALAITIIGIDALLLGWLLPLIAAAC